jgi:hypothetical protein
MNGPNAFMKISDFSERSALRSIASNDWAVSIFAYGGAALLARTTTRTER